MNLERLQVFTGNANPALAKRVCERLELPVGDAMVNRFPDGEINVKINDDVRGRDVFVVQPTCPPVNDSLIELLLLIDTLRRASAMRVTAVIPYYGYARKDRKDEGRVPISAKLVANLIARAGADRVVCLDLHAPQIQGFFDIPVDHLYASPVNVAHFRRYGLADIADGCIVAPDVGGIKQARAYAKMLGLSLAIVDKRRVSPDQAKAVHVIGEVSGKRCILVDDMISTGGTISEAASALREHGAKEVHVCATHGVFCGPAKERLEKAPIDSIVVTDTIPKGSATPGGVVTLSVGDLLGDAILRIHQGRSVSKLFPGNV
ncbi:MAG: Ribose-phosphate pyrophosphokinase [Planctomycetes bacterium]|nr:Ribose-phosphate pyrophosphokinase [Planctomycetota bacterium]